LWGYDTERKSEKREEEEEAWKWGMVGESLSVSLPHLSMLFPFA